MAVHGRGRRGSGRRRLRELTRSVVDTMDILEDVRVKHPGVGGMSKALVQVIDVYLVSHTYLKELVITSTYPIFTYDLCVE